jgi:hypothetical protein
MNDETPNPEENKPIEAEIIPDPKLEQPAFVSNAVPGNMPSLLSTLPQEIIEEMDTRLKGDEPIKFVREDMIKKYPTLEGLKVTYAVWYKRAKKLNGGTQKELKEGGLVKKDMVAALPSAEDLTKAVSSVLDLNLSVDRKQEALSSLFNKATQRLAFLESKNQAYINPDYEILIIQYIKESRALLETVAKLQDTLNKNILDSFKGELDELIRVILTTVYASYRLEHLDSDPLSKFDAFKSTLETHLAQTLKAYKTTTQKPA